MTVNVVPVMEVFNALLLEKSTSVISLITGEESSQQSAGL